MRLIKKKKKTHPKHHNTISGTYVFSPPNTHTHSESLGPDSPGFASSLEEQTKMGPLVESLSQIGNTRTKPTQIAS